MATQAYHNWVAAGEPYTLAAWMNDLVNTLRGHGLTVYHYPDDAHLMAAYPQDHTPFSYTGWPIDSPWGVAFGVDIMPRVATDARALAPLARQIIADKDAGLLPGLKYINWTDDQGNVWQTSWKPTKATRSNTDKGHVHLSGRSDSRNLRLIDYDPIARLTGGDEVTPEDIRAIVAQVINGLINESTNAGYVEGTPGDPLSRQIAQSMDRTIGDLHRKLDAATAATKNRDLEILTAVSAINEAIRVGSGNIETAPIILALHEIRANVERLHVRMDALSAESAQIKAALTELPGGVVNNLIDELTD